MLFDVVRGTFCVHSKYGTVQDKKRYEFEAVCGPRASGY
jgi:hypothetical protein